MGNFTPLKQINKKPKIFKVIVYIILFFVFMTASTYYSYAKKILFFKIKCVPGQLLCQRDNPLVCLGYDMQRVGTFCNLSGDGYIESGCDDYSGCEKRFIYSRSTCKGTGFQGCSVYNHQENCFCVNGKYSCIPDVGKSSCGLNLPGGKPTPLPTPYMTTPVPPTLPLTPTTIPTSVPSLTPASSSSSPTLTPALKIIFD